MKGDKLFTERYEPGLIQNRVKNVVLRTYTHIKGLATDDPDNSTEIIYTPRTEVDQRMSGIHEIFGEDKGIAITSLVSVGTEQRHLFLLDCALPRDRYPNGRRLIAAIERNQRSFPGLRDGMVLRTQNSFHVVGFKPLTLNEWYRHMGQALLLKTDDGQPIADVRYVGHSLERGYGSLRLSDYQGKPTPDFFDWIVYSSSFALDGDDSYERGFCPC